MNDTTQVVVVAPWHTMVKTAMQKHLRSEHNDNNFMSKDTNDMLTARHVQSHDDADQIARGEIPDRYRGHRIERLQNMQARQTLHTHGTSAPTAQEAEVLEQMRASIDLDKPLPAAERKLLEALVDNDFGSLRTEMRQMAADTKAARLAEVEEEWKDKRDEGPRYVAQARQVWESAQQVLADLEKALTDLRDTASVNGVTLTMDQYAARPRLNQVPLTATFEVVGEKEAKDKVIKEVQSDLDRALLSLERQRLGAQRIVALSGVTPEAAKVLDTVPDASMLMVEAAQARVAQQIDK